MKVQITYIISIFKREAEKFQWSNGIMRIRHLSVHNSSGLQTEDALNYSVNFYDCNEQSNCKKRTVMRMEKDLM